MTSTQLETRPDHTPAKTDKAIRVTSVADMFGIGVSTVWLWSGDGRLPAPFKVGKRARWSLLKCQDRLADMMQADEAA